MRIRLQRENLDSEKKKSVPSVWQVLILVPDSLTETLLMVCRQCARRRANIFISLKLETNAVELMPNELNEIGKKSEMKSHVKMSWRIIASLFLVHIKIKVLQLRQKK